MRLKKNLRSAVYFIFHLLSGLGGFVHCHSTPVEICIFACIGCIIDALEIMTDFCLLFLFIQFTAHMFSLNKSRPIGGLMMIHIHECSDIFLLVTETQAPKQNLPRISTRTKYLYRYSNTTKAI